MQNTFSQSGNDSKWFSKKSFFRIGMWNSRPPPSWKKTILNFHFDYLHPSLIITLFSENSTTFSTGFNHCNFSFPSRSRSFPRMEASDSLPEFREWIFFIPFPFPNFGNGFFSFPSRSRILGMDFFHSLPVPELTLSKSGIKRENGRF